jgi:D-sedoheptulose 7-phosphate isomerase
VGTNYYLDKFVNMDICELKAVILVGGLGTRLKSVAGDLPKPMVEIKGKPFLEHLVGFLKVQGIRDFVFCVGYRADVVQDYFGNGSRFGVEIEYAVEEELLGTGGAVKNAEKFLRGGEDFLLLNGDSFIDFDLCNFLSFHEENQAEFTFLVSKSGEKGRFGNLVLDDSNKLKHYQEKQVIEGGDVFVSDGIYLVSSKILSMIPEGKSFSLEYDLVPKLLSEGKDVLGLPVGKELIDIGTPESLNYFIENYDKFFMKSEIVSQINESIEVKKEVAEKSLRDIESVVKELVSVFKTGNKLLICGNGGSAADSQHIAAEFVSSFRSSFNRPSLPAIALTTDTSILTAFTNDFGGEGVFARQVEGLGAEGDALLVISTSGNSENLIRATEEARKKNMKIIGLLGRDGGKMKDKADFSIVVPADDTPRIQEGHVMIYHIICDLVEKGLFGDSDRANARRGLASLKKLDEKLSYEKSSLS